MMEALCKQKRILVLDTGVAGLTSVLIAIGLVDVLYYVVLFFRALSAVVFQNNIVSGALIGVSLFIHSRITFSLMLIAFIAACLFNRFTGIYPEGISYYHLGSNLMMASSVPTSAFS